MKKLIIAIVILLLIFIFVWRSEIKKYRGEKPTQGPKVEGIK